MHFKLIDDENIRKEESWNDINEKYMCTLINKCKINAEQHEKSGYYFKKKNTQWGLPAVLLPTIMAPISVLIDIYPKVSKYINAIAFLLTGIIAGVLSFFKYSEHMTNHFNMSKRYIDISSDIEIELIKQRMYRQQINIFSTKIHMNLDNLIKSAPIIPKFILDKNNII